MAVSRAVLSGGYAFYNYGPTKPAVSLQAYPWFNTTDGRWYVFSGVWRTPVNYSTYERRWFVGNLTQLQTYDGGDTLTASPTSGPMWQEDETMRGRSPMGPGDIPTANPAKILSVAEAFGEGSHVQTTAELASHSHRPLATDATGFLGYPAVVGGNLIVNSSSGNDTASSSSTATTGDSAAMPVIHPVVGLYCIKWTGRAYYIVP